MTQIHESSHCVKGQTVGVTDKEKAISHNKTKIEPILGFSSITCNWCK